MIKNLDAYEICRLIMDAQEIIVTLTGQENVTNEETQYLFNGFQELQKALMSQFKKL